VNTCTSIANSKEWIVHCESENVNVREHKHCILNAASAPYGDCFLSLDSSNASNEVHQYKKYSDKTPLSQQDYMNERQKAASNQDFFLLFTTKECNIELPDNSGIVDKKVWKDYFGPFSGRAFVFADEGPLNINTASRTQLQLIEGIGKAYANTIIEKRKHCVFDSIEIAHEKTQIPEKFLKKFKFS
jgi:hypothetical protein